jgi:signal transduction histidine kinase
MIVLDNALKHTPSGGRITLSVARRGAEATLAVQDNGPGIPGEHVPHLFDRFYRADKARSGSGAGLGLAIAHSLVVAHSGRLEVTSRAGAGTKVMVSLPAMEREPSLTSRLGRRLSRIVDRQATE